MIAPTFEAAQLVTVGSAGLVGLSASGRVVALRTVPCNMVSCSTELAHDEGFKFSQLNLDGGEAGRRV